MKTFRLAAASAGLVVGLLTSGAAFGSTISKNLPAPVNQSVEGVQKAVNAAGKPVHDNVRDIGQNMEGGKRRTRHYTHVRHVTRTRRYHRRLRRHHS